MPNPKRAFPGKVHLAVFLVLLAISLFSLRGIFATPDPVAFHDFAPMYRLEQLFRPYDFPWDYKSNLGTASLLTGNAVYNVPLIGFSLLLGSVALANKLVLLLCMAFSGFGFYLAFAYLLKSKTAGFVAGLAMMFNPFTLTRWEFGHNIVLLAFAVLPFAMFAFFKVMKEGSRLFLFLCGLLTAMMIYSSPQVAYLFMLFTLMYTAFDVAFSENGTRKKRLLLRIVQMTLMLVLALVAAFPFFYQLVMVNQPVYLTRAEEATAAVFTPDIVGMLIPQAALTFFTIGAFLWLWWKSGFKKMSDWWKTNPTDSQSPYLIKPARQPLVLFAILGLLSVVVVLIVIPPFTPIYYWLFNNVPGFGMFREVDKFFMISALALAFFLAVITVGFKNYLYTKTLRLTKSTRTRRFLPLFLITIIVLAAGWPFLTGDMNGTVGTVQVPDAYQQLNSWLYAQNGDFRIAFFPPAVWATTYTWQPRWFLDPVVALQAKPTLEIKSESDLTKGADFTRWIYTTLYSNRTSEWGKLLSLVGVKYVIIRLDADMPPDRGDLAAFSLANTPPEMINGHGLGAFSLAKTLAVWGEQESLRLVQNFSSILVYENTYELPPVYQTNELSLVVGDRATLLSMGSLNFDFASNPAVFLDDNLGSTQSLINDSQYLFFQGDQYWGLLTSYLGPEYIVKPWEYAPVSAGPWDKWVNGELTWYFWNGDANVAVDGFAYTESQTTLTVPLSVKSPGNYRVLAQVYDGLPNAQGVRFQTSTGFEHTVWPTCQDEGTYKWVDLGTTNLDSNSKLDITNLGGPVAISKIAVVPANLVNDLASQVSHALKNSAAKQVYLFDDRAWTFNHTTALVVNPEANNGRLISLANSSATTMFSVFNDGNYNLNLTFQGSTHASAVTLYVDGAPFDLTIKGGAGNFSSTIRFAPLVLSAGYHNITLTAAEGKPMFNQATLTNFAEDGDSNFHGTSNADVPSYQMRSGSEYTVTPTSKYLAFLEAGNGYWNLNGQDGAATQICLFNYGSLFQVPNPGATYTLTYLGLSYVQQGYIVAIVGIIAFAVGLKFVYPKRFFKRTPERTP